jgi:putative peptidoglycan lipid II flippase
MISEGSVSYIFYTNRLTELVLGVFLVSIGNGVLPEMSKLTAMDEKNKFSRLFTDSMSSALFLAVPATAGLISAGIPIISVIFMHGKFTYADVLMTYNSLICASAGIVFVSALRIATPAFYSMKDTKTPVISASIALVINLVLGYILMQTSLKHAGLTLANTISAVVQMLILMARLEQKTGGIDVSGILKSFMKFTVAAILMSGVVLWIASFTDWHKAGAAEGIISLVVSVSSGGAVYFISC